MGKLFLIIFCCTMLIALGYVLGVYATMSYKYMIVEHEKSKNESLS
jgi:hypothetical protein